MSSDNNRHKIVYVFPHLPTIDFSKKFFTKQLQEDYETEYWDVGPILGYDMKFTFDMSDDQLEVKKIIGLLQLYRLLKKQNSITTVFVMQITRMHNSLLLFYIFSICRVKMVTLARGYLPVLRRSERSLRHYVDGFLKMYQLKIWLGSSIFFFITKFIPIRNYDIAFVAGRMAEKINSKLAHKLVNIHHSDIDIAIVDEKFHGILPNKFCVFVDDYLPYHPDFAITGAATLDPQSYYQSLNSFFESIESVYGLKVVIAAHPKAVYTDNPFSNRLIFFNQTNALIKESELVLVHASTAISFIVFHGKAPLLIFNDQIKATHPVLFNSMVSTARVLNCDLINMDKNGIVDSIMYKVDAKSYSHYISDYLTLLNVKVNSVCVFKAHLQNLTSPSYIV